MRFLETKEAALKTIVVPGLPELLTRPAVKTLAESIRTLKCVLNEPYVRIIPRRGNVQYEAIEGLGYQRLAALHLLKRARAWIKVVDCSPEEGRLLASHEEAFRWHDPDEKNRRIQALLSIAQRQLARYKPGKSRSIAAAARQIVSRETGYSVKHIAAVESRIRRAANAKSESPPKTIQTLGMELDPAFSEEMAKITRRLGGLASVLGSASAAVAVAKRRPDYRGTARRLDAAHDAIAQAAKLLAGAVPVSLCPYCKGIAAIQEQCVGCKGSGWLSQAQQGAVPQELWDERAMKVLLNGHLVSADAYLGR